MTDYRPFFRKKEWIPLLLLLFFGFFFYYLFSKKPSASYAEIYVDSKKVMEVDLSNDQTFSPPGAEGVIIEVKNRSIGFISSDCPDHICIQTGFLSKPGQLAVCLPNKVTVKIPSSAPSVDDVTGTIGGIS